MSTFMRVLKTNLFTDNQAILGSQIIYFVAAPFMLLSCVIATTRLAESPFQVFLGLAAGAIIAFQLVAIGLILSAMKRS